MKEQERTFFVEFMEEYASFFERAVSQEERKQAALRSNQLDEIEKTVAEQQAIVMEMANLEKRRLVLQEEAGLFEMTFRQVTEALDGDLRQRSETAMHRLEDAIFQLKSENAISMDIAKGKIDIIARISPEMVQQQSSYSTYGKKGPEKNGGRFFESKI